MTLSKIEPGTKRNMLTFIKENGILSGHIACDVECECGNTTNIRKDKFIKGLIKSCGCKSTTYKAMKNKPWLNPDYAFWVLLERCMKRSNTNNFEFNLTEEYLKTLWIRQQGLCAYTKTQLRLPRCFTDLTDYNIPSIDRIDPTKGYIIGNVQFTLKCINFMKYQMNHNEFIKTCRLIAKNYVEAVN